MRQDFDRYFKDPNEQSWVDKGNSLLFLISKSGLAMCLWYGTLFVVVEGWQEAKLSDPEIDRLLASPNVPLLKRFRNGMFHFQSDQWLSPKLSDFFDPKNNTVAWVRALTREFRRYFLAEMKRINTPPVVPRTSETGTVVT
jgi:hypothetical protein